MRNPERIPKVLDAVRRLWEQHPDWRLGQLVAYLGVGIGKQPNFTPMELPDDELLRRIEEELGCICIGGFIDYLGPPCPMHPIRGSTTHD